MDFLEKLKQDPNCLYIYNWGPYIYGLDKEPREYLVITKNKPLMVACMKEGIGYQFISINDWFEKVLRGDIRCWECACMNKKFIIKEHVKLMMSTNPLNLRKEIDAILNSDVPEQTSRELLIKIYGKRIKACKFANQIIDNHKIVNFKEANKDYILLSNADDVEQVYNLLITNPYSELRSKTDDILRRSKIEKVLQKKKNE